MDSQQQFYANFRNYFAPLGKTQNSLANDRLDYGILIREYDKVHTFLLTYALE